MPDSTREAVLRFQRWVQSASYDAARGLDRALGVDLGPGMLSAFAVSGAALLDLSFAPRGTTTLLGRVLVLACGAGMAGTAVSGLHRPRQYLLKVAGFDAGDSAWLLLYLLSLVGTGGVTAAFRDPANDPVSVLLMGLATAGSASVARAQLRKAPEHATPTAWRTLSSVTQVAATLIVYALALLWRGARSRRLRDTLQRLESGQRQNAAVLARVASSLAEPSASGR